MGDPKNPTDYRGRSIPWLPVVRFHKEVVARAEQSFFSLNAREDHDERWTSLTPFNLDDLVGPWELKQEEMRSNSFRLALDQEQHESIFLGGPCYVGWKKTVRGNWVPEWRPLLYREVELNGGDGTYQIIPKAGSWTITPLLNNLLARLEVDVSNTLEEFTKELVEKATNFSREHQLQLESGIMRVLFLLVPELEPELTKSLKDDTFRVTPSPWVLFAPTKRFSALTVHLMSDYDRLEKLLEENPEQIGGLKLLEDHPRQIEGEDEDVLPVIPLNESQRNAVKEILDQRPLTVISGPPGTGKSQVVVALLLNAWARGQTVLFASNNNKAVDVVRERVERFESEFPIAVRAGARQKQNIQEVLRRTLNMAGLAAEEANGLLDPVAVKNKREELMRSRASLQGALESGLPQRIDELRKTALNAYGAYRATMAKIIEEERNFESEMVGVGFKGRSSKEIEESANSTQSWLDRIEHFQSLFQQDNQRRARLEEEVKGATRRRDRIAEEVGLPLEEAGDWNWVLTGPTWVALSEWMQRIQGILEKPIEQALEPIEWRVDYDKWHSEEEAEKWVKGARAFLDNTHRTNAEIAPLIDRINHQRTLVEEWKEKLKRHSIRENVDISLEVLQEWTSIYIENTTKEKGRMDFLPWSNRARFRRRLHNLERQIKPCLPIEVWTKIGIIDDEKRNQLAPILEELSRWLEIRRDWESAQSDVEKIESRFRDLRSEAASLRLKKIPVNQDANVWDELIRECEDIARLGEEASFAWHRRAEKESSEEKLRTIAKEYSRIGSGIPIREAWRKGIGSSFDTAMKNLSDSPNPTTVSAARSAIYKGLLNHLIEIWEKTSDSQQTINRLEMEIGQVPIKSDRVKEWWAERPPSAFVLGGEPTPDWPDCEGALESVRKVSDWVNRYHNFTDTMKPNMLNQATQEMDWAIQKLEQAIEVLPETQDRGTITQICHDIKTTSVKDWPIQEINDIFAEFSPERIRANIERIEAELERGSFEDAKGRWLERLREDDEAIKAVNDLERSLSQNRGKVREGFYDIFRTVLRVVPIWVTTAQASQAIPLLPELFDIVVIDEASQCTLTNLLPLMFRGRKLAVIGDADQLPAIPTIEDAEEIALATKFEIEQYVSLVGHAGNDVYKTAAESLPRRRADVVMLKEHFRSNPQIIGFSNRHIYLQRLELKKDPSWGKKLPVGSGVHTIPIAGQVERGSEGRSWVNRIEAEKVIDLIKEIKDGDARSMSLGVVTPFAAQKEILRERVTELGFSSEVLVDTAYGFQGDERDIIIFSPVVGKGINPSSSRWVESPPNLINVAITRAREALFFVGDLDYCLQQEGILRKLALYCKEIQLLRDTSPAELELFSWMVVKAWEPKVHPQIGDIEVDFTLKGKSGEQIAIEVDGAEHHEQRVETDKARDAFLQGQGYVVLRFPARAVLETPFEVIHQIEERMN